MDTSKCRVRSCDALNITEQESQWNLQMFTPMMKQETVQHLDEEEISQCMDEEKTIQCIGQEENFRSDYMSLCNPLQTSDCINYRDSKFDVFEELKKEFPEDECPQSVHDRSSRLVFKNEELSQVIGRQEFKQENSEESFSLIKNEKIDNEQYPVIDKIESLEEHRVLDHFGDAGVHCDVLVTPQQVQCDLCDRTFTNRYTLLIHHNEHIKNVMYPTPVAIELNKLHKCKCCHEHFDSHDNMLAHVRDVHSNERRKSELYHEDIKKYTNRKNSEKMEYKCNLCERFYKSKPSLVEHIKNIHVDYGRMFECWCGKQFRSPIKLSRHKGRQHNPNVKNINNQQFQCDYCHKCFKTKPLLIAHIKRMHYDYGKTFECSCGVQFRSSFDLSQHKKQLHNPNVKIINNQQFQCDSCHKFFPTKYLLVVHIKRMHYDYGKTFECSCGKQFRTPLHLYQHNQHMHCADGKNINNERIQCYICKKLVKTKRYLTAHIKSVHYNYSKTFECSCGKQFRSPIHLSEHKDRRHCADVKEINNQECQCDTCHKCFKTRSNLIGHIKRMHYDYGKRFECWCGKHFRTPNHIYQHKKRQHYADFENINIKRAWRKLSRTRIDNNE